MSDAGKYADMDTDERAVAMANDCVGDPWELLGYFREKLRRSEVGAQTARQDALKLALKLAECMASKSSTATPSIESEIAVPEQGRVG